MVRNLGISGGIVHKESWDSIPGFSVLGDRVRDGDLLLKFIESSSKTFLIIYLQDASNKVRTLNTKHHCNFIMIILIGLK